jgi:alpha-beta hydrolase superfamily lysophospholipase
LFRFFPDNYMWSLAMLRCLAGGGNFGEIAWACAGLGDAAKVQPTGDVEAWHLAWKRLAEQLETIAGDAANQGHKISAREAYYRAAQYYQWTEAFLPPEDPRAEKAYARHLSTFAQFATLSEPRVEIFDIPFEGNALKAYFVAPVGVAGRAPVVILSDGLDGTKEEMFPCAQALAQRGIACLAVDGPGQGATLRLSGLPARADSEAWVGAGADYLERRPDVDARRLGLWAASLGGYYAPRAAAFEKRVKACVAWAAIYDYQAVWYRRLNYQPGKPITLSTGTAIGTTHRQLFNILGVSDWEKAFAVLEKFRLHGVAEKITCDLLIVHGEDDKQTPLAEAERLFAEAPSRNKEFWAIGHDTGGAAHVQLDRPEPTVSRIADWFTKRL